MGGQPLALKPALHVGHGRQHGVDPPRLDLARSSSTVSRPDRRHLRLFAQRPRRAHTDLVVCQPRLSTAVYAVQPSGTDGGGRAVPAQHRASARRRALQRRLIERLLVHGRRETGEEPACAAPTPATPSSSRTSRSSCGWSPTPTRCTLRAAHGLSAGTPRVAAARSRGGWRSCASASPPPPSSAVADPRAAPLAAALLRLERLLIELGDRTYPGRAAGRRLRTSSRVRIGTWQVAVRRDETPAVVARRVTRYPGDGPAGGAEEAEATRERPASAQRGSRSSVSHLVKARWALKQRVAARPSGPRHGT